jgi:hypothetical protein
MGTNPEHRLASLAVANALPENHFSMNRHPPMQADFDNGNGSCQGRTSFNGGLLMKVAEPEPRCSNGGVLLPPPKPQYRLLLKCFEDDDRRMIAPSARMMLLGVPYAGQRPRKLRFLMTDSTVPR